MDDINLPNGVKVPGWAGIAAVGGALLVVLMIGKSGRESTSGNSGDILIAETEQRLQQEKDQREAWEAAQAEQWQELLARLEAMFNGGGGLTPAQPIPTPGSGNIPPLTPGLPIIPPSPVTIPLPSPVTIPPLCLPVVVTMAEIVTNHISPPVMKTKAGR